MPSFIIGIDKTRRKVISAHPGDKRPRDTRSMVYYRVEADTSDDAINQAWSIFRGRTGEKSMKRVVIRRKISTRALGDRTESERNAYQDALDLLSKVQNQVRLVCEIVQAYDAGMDRLGNKAHSTLAAMKAYLNVKIRSMR